MSSINIHEAKTHFSRLISRVQLGEEIVISKSGRPVARLIPEPRPRKPRQPGSAKGEMIIHDNFDDPLPDDVLQAFDGNNESR